MPEFDPQGIDTTDELAKQEAVKFGAKDDLEEEGKKKEHLRTQIFKDHIHYAVLGLFWLIVIGLAAGISVYAFHMLTPDSDHFLTEKALDKLQTVLASAVLSSALTGYAKQRMG
jgi:hypothetical protein